jgi:aspartate kinase
VEGKGFPKILNRIKELKARDDVGPIAVFSAPIGCTDALIRIGESYAQSAQVPIDPVFKVYEHIAKLNVKAKFLRQAQAEIARYRKQTQQALASVNKRFSGNVKAKILTHGGELAMSALADHILKSNGVNSCQVSVQNWPIVTDDNFDDATPNYDLSKKRVDALIAPLEEGKVVSLAGFLGVTADGLETVLGRGGSDLTAVFISVRVKGR